MVRMTHQEYIAQQRRRVVVLAWKIIHHEMDVLEAAHEIARLRFELDVEDSDEDLAAFFLVESETEALPIGEQRQYWSEEALRRKEPELCHARVWAFRAVEESCRNLLRRFR